MCDYQIFSKIHGAETKEKKTKQNTKLKENTFKDSSEFWSQICIIRAVLIVKTSMSMGNRKY